MNLLRLLFASTLFCLTIIPAYAAKERPIAEVVEDIEGTYAHYLSQGRSDVILHMTPAGEEPKSVSTMDDAGAIMCRVSGLSTLPRLSDMTTSRLLFAGAIIHEVTHCRTSPYVNIPTEDDGRTALLRSVIILNLESIADAHALIRLAQKHSFDEMRKYIQVLLFMRVRPQRADHATARALREAFSLIADKDTRPVGEAATFAAAITIGRKTAMEQAAIQYPNTALLDFGNIAKEFDAGLARALRAFDSGKFDNSSATMHFTEAPFATGDHHFYVGNDESIEYLPVRGNEGAHEAKQ